MEAASAGGTCYVRGLRTGRAALCEALLQLVREEGWHCGTVGRHLLKQLLHLRASHHRKPVTIHVAIRTTRAVNLYGSNAEITGTRD